MVEVTTKANEATDVEEAEEEVELPEDTIALEILLNTRDGVMI